MSRTRGGRSRGWSGDARAKVEMKERPNVAMKAGWEIMFGSTAGRASKKGTGSMLCADEKKGTRKQVLMERRHPYTCLGQEQLWGLSAHRKVILLRTQTDQAHRPRSSAFHGRKKFPTRRSVIQGKPSVRVWTSCI